MDTRLRISLSVYLFGALGLFLCVAPWTPVWNQAAFAVLPPGLAAWARAGWVRGVVSGIGALDLFVALDGLRRLWRLLGDEPGSGQKKGDASAASPAESRTLRRG